MPDKRQKLQDTGLVDWSVFSELLVMDEDEEGFSQSLFKTFVDQVIETFQKLDKHLSAKDLNELSDLGHYLKGSAAAIGLIQISSQCERIQNYGHKINFDNFDITDSPVIKQNNTTTIPKTTTTTTSSSTTNEHAILTPVTSTTKTSIPPSSDPTIHKDSKPLPPPPTSAIPDEDSDDFWILLINDALNKARDAFAKSRVALNEYFDVEY